MAIDKEAIKAAKVVMQEALAQANLIQYAGNTGSMANAIETALRVNIEREDTALVVTHIETYLTEVVSSL